MGIPHQRSQAKASKAGKGLCHGAARATAQHGRCMAGKLRHVLTALRGRWTPRRVPRKLHSQGAHVVRQHPTLARAVRRRPD